MSEFTSAKVAIQSNKSNDYARWKGSETGARERILQKVVVPIGRQSFFVEEGASFFAIGSCFARNVEERLHLAGANVLSLDLEMEDLGATSARKMGIFNKYNPYSILQELQFASGEREYPDGALLPSDQESFYDAQLRVSSGKGTKEQLLKRRAQIDTFFKQAFTSDVLIITYGLIETWYDTETDLYLNEMPSPRLAMRNPDRFKFKALGVEECKKVMENIVALIRRHSKAEQKLLFTVSPVPLGRTFTSDDVIVANMTSKMTLRVAALETVNAIEGIDYFPSFEGAMNSDPDLVWQTDRLHVSDFIVGHLINTFLVRYGLTPATEAEEIKTSMSIEEKLIRSLNREVDHYKNQTIRLQNELKEAGKT